MIIRTAAKAIFTVTAFTIATRVLSFIFKIYLSRTVGAEVIGLYQIALSVYAMLTCITASGIPLTLSRKTAEYNISGKTNLIPSLISSSIITGFIGSFAVVTLIFLFRGSLEFIFKDTRAIPLFLIMLPALFSTTIYTILRGWFWGNKDFVSFSFGELVEEILRIIFTVLLAGGIISALKGELGIALAFTLSDILVAFVMLYIFYRKGGKIKKPKEIRSLIKSSTPVTAMRLFSGIVSSLTAIIIPARLALYGMSVSEATTAFGRMVGLAFPLIVIPLSLTGSITTVIIPEVSGQNALGNVKGIAGKIDKAITISVAFTALFLSIYLAFGKEIGIIIYNDAIAGQFVRVGSWMMILIIITQITSAVLNSLAMETTAFINFAISTMIMLFLIFFLPRYSGIYSLIIANTIFYLITLILNTYSLNSRGFLELKFIKICLLSILFAIPCAYIGRSLFELIGEKLPLFLNTMISSIFIIFLYCLLLMCIDLIDIKYFYVSRLKGLMKKRAGV